MATMTAFILVGAEHNFHGGINATHTLALYENSRPAWVLNNYDPNNSARRRSPVIWIPTVDNMFEDGLLLLGLHAFKARALLAADELSLRAETRVEMYGRDQTVLARMRQINAEQAYESKIIVSVFEMSSIERSQPVLNNYHMRWEWCVSGGAQGERGNT